MKLSYVVDGCIYGFAKLVAIILKLVLNSFDDIWLIGERTNEAKDNGYHLFKYIREQHPEKKVYYVIEQGSQDVGKIECLGNIVYHKSFKHYVYYALATKLICAHLSSCVPNSPVAWKFHPLEMKTKKKALIRHGITKELLPQAMYENTRADLFVCGAKPEYDFVVKEFGYLEGAVKYLGLARFDNLVTGLEKKQILVMPTWRQWISGSTWATENQADARSTFQKTQYYQHYQNLITNPALITLLEQENIELIFYPHYEMQGYLDLFETNSERVIIAAKDKFDVQQLLKESQVLITDYSSVAFDFGYMEKPVIYYQFDETEYYQNHYQKGYYDYDIHGFGPKVETEQEIVKELQLIVENGLDVKYYSRIEQFFPLRDQRNCQRNYEAIKQL
ncbi:MAG: CDP-glycerol glycerophosphotransferase family protein [Culicoidibacterales bacterium]